MDVGDTQLVTLLEARDGAMPARSWPHTSSDGPCRYTGALDGKPCPWCEAARRRERERNSSP